MAQKTTSSLPTIGEVIRAWREFHGLRSTELAALAGVRSQYLSEIEHNRTANPREEYLEKLAVPLKITLQDIYGRRMPPEKGEDSEAKEHEKQAISKRMPPTVHPSLTLVDSIWDNTWEEIEGIFESGHLSEAQSKVAATELKESAKQIARLMKLKHEK